MTDNHIPIKKLADEYELITDEKGFLVSKKITRVENENDSCF